MDHLKHIIKVQSQRLQAYAQLERSFEQYKLDAIEENHNTNIQSSTRVFSELSAQLQFICEVIDMQKEEHEKQTSLETTETSKDKDDRNGTENVNPELVEYVVDYAMNEKVVEFILRIQSLEKLKLDKIVKLQVVKLENAFGEKDFTNDIASIEKELDAFKWIIIVRLVDIAGQLDDILEDIKGEIE